MATITITGGTGLVGSALTKKLLAKGHTIFVLTRKARPAAGRVVYKEWDIEKGTIDPTAIREADYIVHLAGANVAGGRWTEKRKKEIVDSRVKSGELLVKSLHNLPNNVKAVISASAQGWYGEDPRIPNPRPFVETDPPDQGFLGRTCKLWEDAISPVTTLGKRLVIFRLGIVLSNEGGAYVEFKKPVQLGAAAILGKGNQVVSWIHINDLARLFTTAIEANQWQGVYNAVAPNPVSNKALVTEIARQRGRFSIPFHVPSFVLKAMLGEMSTEVLKSTTVSAIKAEANGFTFLYPTIDKAVAALTHKED
ncbi:TIGR01777 family oxidoreductase [Flavisolibacter nicotianae]|uniref:TIGR01777 family oxidoreductase n=1 Tax=Flavisolibacter nicotianae TaxID=2364882 RepID=UPI000EAB4B91|nr:TIGR01777 family oxidoreductase [Flavisolibacter nicotianae]